MRVGIIWLFVFAAYYLFAGSAGLHETVTAAILATLGTAWTLAIRAVAPNRFAMSREFATAVLLGLANLVTATACTAWLLFMVAAFGGAPGRSHAADFRFGDGDDPGERSRRALAVLLASLAPDRFVVLVNPERGQVLLHDLDPYDRELDPRWLQ